MSAGTADCSVNSLFKNKNGEILKKLVFNPFYEFLLLIITLKMSALFACTRCAKRYPFEELSDIEQLCKVSVFDFRLFFCSKAITFCFANIALHALHFWWTLLKY